MRPGEKILTDAAVSTAINLAQKARGIVLIPLITKLLGTAAYGVFVQVTLVANLLNLVFRIGLDKALVRYMQSFDSERDQAAFYYAILTFTLGSGVIGATAVFYLSEPISYLSLGTNQYAEAFQVGAFLIPIYAGQSISQNYFRSMRRVKTFSILDGAKVYLSLSAAVVVLLVFDLGLIEVLAAVAIVEALFVFGLNIYIILNVGLAVPDFRELGRCFRYSAPFLITSISEKSRARADRLLLGYFVGPTAVGVYSIADTFALLLRMYVLPLRVTLFPEFSKLWEDNQRETCYRYLRNGLRYFLALSLPSVAGLWLIGYDILTLMSNPETATAAASVLVLLAGGRALLGIEILHRQIFNVAELTGLVSIISAGGAVLNITLNVILIPRFGVWGAAVTTLLTYGVSGTVIYLLSRKKFVPSLAISFVAKITASTIVMAGVVSLLELPHFVLDVLVAPIIYFALLFSLGAVTREEFTFIVKAIRSSGSGS